MNYHPYKISYSDIKIIDNLYKNFSLETSYGIKIVDRKVQEKLQGMFEPWMLREKEYEPGVVDFRPRECSNIMNLWVKEAIAPIAEVLYGRRLDF